MSALRTPPWEAICFTQTGQRSGELTANYDQIDARECPGAEVCVSSGFRLTKGALDCLLRSISPPTVAVFWQCLSSVRINSALLKVQGHGNSKQHLSYFSDGKVNISRHALVTVKIRCLSGSQIPRSKLRDIWPSRHSPNAGVRIPALGSLLAEINHVNDLFIHRRIFVRQ